MGLYYDNSKKLNTYASGITVTGHVDVLSGSVYLEDNGKAIFGTGSDLQIYHDGSHSFIKDTGTGSLWVYASNFNVASANGGEALLKCAENGAVELYYDNSKKLETMSGGAKITGSLGIGTTPANVLHSVGTTRINQSSTLGNTTNAGTMLEVRGNAIGDGVVDYDYFKGFKIALNDQTEWGGQAQFAVGRWQDSGNSERSSLMISLGHGQSNSSTDADTDVLLLKSNGSVTISDGDLVIGTAGHGIDFSATSDASGATSELLDDYEEGTWTPTVYSSSAGNFTYATNGQLGIYTKVGNIVHVNGFVQATVGGTETGQVRLGSLPFTVSNTGANYAQVLINDYGNFDSYDGHVGGYVYPGQTYVILIFSKEGNSSTISTIQWGTNTYIYFSITYRV